MDSNSSPARFLASLLISLAFLIGGTLFGLIMARVMAPGSFVAGFIGFFMLPTSLVLGITIWLGTAVISFGLRFFWGILRTRSLRQTFTAVTPPEIPPGKITLVVVPIFICLISGGLTTLVTEKSGLLVILVYFSVGLAYGGAMWLAAHIGVFDEFFEPTHLV